MDFKQLAENLQAPIKQAMQNQTTNTNTSLQESSLAPSKDDGKLGKDVKLMLQIAQIFYYLLYPIAWVVYKIAKQNIIQFSIDFVFFLQSKAIYKTADVIAIIESDDFKSKLCKENKNPFGMRLPAKRVTFAKGAQNGFALYKSYYCAAADLAVYLSVYGKQIKNIKSTNPIELVSAIAKVLVQLKYVVGNLGGYANPQMFVKIANKKDTRYLVGISLVSSSAMLYLLLSKNLRSKFVKMLNFKRKKNVR